MKWPRCLTEERTMHLMLGGRSIARFGDGELTIALGNGTSTHKSNPKLAKEFRSALKDLVDGCIIAIPTMNGKDPTIKNWLRNRERFSRVLNPDLIYGSAFVGRPKCAPWIQTDEFVDSFKRLWRGKKVVAVCKKKQTPKQHSVYGRLGQLPLLLSQDATEVQSVFCPETEAYAEIDRIEQECLEIQPDIVVACAGPMATALAVRLAKKRVQCIDLGRGLGLIVRHKSNA